MSSAELIIITPKKTGEAEATIHVSLPAADSPPRKKSKKKKKLKPPEDPYAPRPVRRDCEQGRLLLALEVAECNCHGLACFEGKDGYPVACPGMMICKFCPLEPCRHVRDKAWEVERDGFPISLADWATLMENYDPAGYAEREPSPEGGKGAFCRESRVALLKERAVGGWSLRHADDVVALEGEALDRVAIEAVKGKAQGDYLAPSFWEDDEDAPPTELCLDLGRKVPEGDRIAARSLALDRAAARAAEANRLRDRALLLEGEEEKAASAEAMVAAAPGGQEAPMRPEWYAVRLFDPDGDRERLARKARLEGFRIYDASTPLVTPTLAVYDPTRGEAHWLTELMRRMGIGGRVETMPDPRTTPGGWCMEWEEGMGEG